MHDGPREACGIFGAWLPAGEQAGPLIRSGLRALQHRGQEAAGIAVSDGRKMALHKDTGLVSQVFSDNVLSHLAGNIGIGHTRYSTAGTLIQSHAQPFVRPRRGGGSLALAHNGTIAGVGRAARCGEPRRDGPPPSDSELLTELIAGFGGEVPDCLRAVLADVEGAWSLVLLDEKAVYAARDAYGFRPLCFGRLGSAGWAFASESCALDEVGATHTREIRPGECVIASPGELRVVQFVPAVPRLCALEQIYLGRRDSWIGNRSLHSARKAMGRALAAESPVAADVVVPVPATGTSAAIGFAAASGIPYDEGLLLDRYSARTFIEPTQQLRARGVRKKLTVVPDVVAGRRLVLIDDSIVRGTTMRAVLDMLREAGAVQLHLRIASPPIRWPCIYGVDMASTEELVAHDKDIPAIARLLGADSLAYLSLPTLRRICGAAGSGVCDACFTGRYPTKLVGADNSVTAVDLVPCARGGAGQVRHLAERATGDHDPRGVHRAAAR